MKDFPTINWVTFGETASDYRPAIGADGQTAIFERTQNSDDAASVTKLYIMDILSSDAPVALLPNNTGNIAQTRPDWYWPTNTIVFNSKTEAYTVKVHPIKQTHLNKQVAVAGTLNMGYVYLQWNSGGDSFTVMNGGDTSTPHPCSTVISTNGEVIYANINGYDEEGMAVYGGMPGVNPITTDSIAFAGQPVLPGWQHPESAGLKYNQGFNYIFLNTVANGVFSSAPMEAKAPLDHFDKKFQGRAPAWSPDGRYIVFESDRIDDTYALFLFDTQGNDAKLTRLTDTAYPSQHAKFFPDGKKLIFCGKQNAKDTNNSIGWIDITPYIH